MTQPICLRCGEPRSGASLCTHCEAKVRLEEAIRHVKYAMGQIDDGDYALALGHLEDAHADIDEAFLMVEALESGGGS